MKKYVFSFLALLFFVPTCLSQNNFMLILKDGSRVMATSSDSLECKTPYGILKIPIKEIQKIDFAFRTPEEMQKKIKAAIEGLGSDKFPERLSSQKYLEGLSKYVYPFLKASFPKEIKNLEKHKRLESLVHRLEDFYTHEDLLFPIQDTVFFGETKLTCDLLQQKINFKTSLGEVSVELHNLINIYKQQASAHSMTVPYNDGNWTSTNISIFSGMKLISKASGQVDVYPQNLGQYMAGPGGYGSTVNGFNAGALLAKIGRNGKIFKLGDYYKQSVKDNGILYLKINDGPGWGGTNEVMGSFSINIKVDN